MQRCRTPIRTLVQGLHVGVRLAAPDFTLSQLSDCPQRIFSGKNARPSECPHRLPPLSLSPGPGVAVWECSFLNWGNIPVKEGSHPQASHFPAGSVTTTHIPLEAQLAPGAESQPLPGEWGAGAPCCCLLAKSGWWAPWG